MPRFSGMRTPRRRKGWLSVPGLSTTLTANGITLASGSLTFTGPGNTVMRIIGRLALGFDTLVSVSASDQARVTLGLGLFSGDAVTAGAGSLPDPAEDPEYGWMLWKELEVHAFLAEGAGAPFIPEGDSFMSWDFDSKVMRKTGTETSMIWVAQYEDIVGTPAVRLRVATTRVLVALP